MRRPVNSGLEALEGLPFYFKKKKKVLQEFHYVALLVLYRSLNLVTLWLLPLERQVSHSVGQAGPRVA